MSQQYFEYDGLRVPVRPLEPGQSMNVDKLFIKESLNPRVVKALMANIIEGIPSMLVGPTGAGKTATVKWLASVTNNKYKRFQLTGSTDVDTLIGRNLLNDKGTYWVDGILTEWMKVGGYLLVDEINMALPEVVAVINSILDDDAVLVLADKDNEVVYKHPDARIFAAMNPSDDYTGTKDMNKATFDRFSVLEFEYPDNDSELAIIEKHSGLSRDIGKITRPKKKSITERMVEFANATRKKKIEADFVSAVSTRQLIQWAKLVKYVDIKHAAELTIINKAERGDRKHLKDELDAFFKDGETLESNKADQIKFDAKLANSEADEGLDIVEDTTLVEDLEELELTNIPITGPTITGTGGAGGAIWGGGGMGGTAHSMSPSGVVMPSGNITYN